MARKPSRISAGGPVTWRRGGVGRHGAWPRLACSAWCGVAKRSRPRPCPLDSAFGQRRGSCPPVDVRVAAPSAPGRRPAVGAMR
jgi:hypothetical protein